ncbi:type-F conjugative transfer system protein TraW [Duganella sp. FT92W]|uniref:Type-F conjugative transfer system protein TraW n=1 Tax=Pseudoduganella rivuli TaxID=2666085 RepID=A0A7X2IIC9_9BURK|nr:type-F conjugative transfer system protein TraW [Pseudoduganella rivuli]MRV70579.1 type-F conjugative transfer system protein TraW [Pseudoduganella rivuli]
MHAMPIPLCILLLLSGSAVAEDLGALGKTYPVTEPDFLKMIEQRLKEKQSTGELQRLQEDAVRRGRDVALHPAPVANVVPCTSARTRYLDPSVVLSRNILDAQGRLLFTAGSRFNPLSVTEMHKKLLFFDARDKRQVDKALLLLRDAADTIKPILTGGSYLDLSRAWRRQVYFDQQGLLIKRFGIQQVPAVVYQEGMRLRIDELELRQ